LTVFLRRFIPWVQLDQENGKLILGRKKADAFYAERLLAAKDWTRQHMGNMPCLLGEFGLPFDMNGRKAFKSGDYRAHEQAFTRYYDAIDRALLHSTVWNYTADNTHADGDHWNAEDFSIFGEGEARAAKGWLRPYPMATAGIPLEITWNRKRLKFCYRFRANPAITAPTIIFAPACYFGQNARIEIAGEGPYTATPAARGNAEKAEAIRREYHPEENNALLFNDGYDGVLVVTISPGA
jgi:hypothetical protein